MPETLTNSDNSKQQYCKYIAAVLQMLLKKKANNKSPGSEKVEGCGGGVSDQHHKPLRIHRLAVFLSDDLLLVYSQSIEIMAFIGILYCTMDTI